MVDVDHFKRINDTHGHAAGDRVLKEIVERVASALRPSDLVTRRGGDEFAVVMPETDLDAAIQVAGRLCGRIGDAPIEGVAVTVSIGAAASRPDEEEELDATLQRADTSLYEAKRAGGNRVSPDGSGEPQQGEIPRPGPLTVPFVDRTARGGTRAGGTRRGYRCDGIGKARELS